MLARLHAEFDRQVTLATLFRAPTIRGLAKALQQKDTRDFDFRQVVRLQPNGSRPALIAINNTGTFYPVARHLGPDQPFISLQLFDPSTKSDALPDTLEEVAAQYVQLIGRVQPRGPYSLIGWCAAGALAFEIASQLALARRRVSHLFLMDAWVPNYIARQPPMRRVVAGYSLRFQMMWADWRRVATGEQSLTSFLMRRTSVIRLRKLFTSNARPAAETATHDSPALSRYDYDQWLLRYLQRLTAKYEPKVFPGKITLLRSVDEPTGLLFDPKAGWERFARDGLELRIVTGDHFTMFQEPGAVELAQFIATATLTDPRNRAQANAAQVLATNSSGVKAG
jgi:thioesterase domain-containing protein